MPDPLDELPDAVAADAFRRLVRHLRHRHDAQNIDLMGLAGFCRNCLADWIRDAGYPGDKAAAREVIHGMAFLGTADIIDDEGKWGDEDGDITILQTGKEKKVLAEMNMGSAVYATPVPAHGEPQSLDLTLPPLATIVLRAEG